MAANLPANPSTPDFLGGFASLNLIRQLGLMVGLAGAVALGVWVVLWSQEPSWRPLLQDIHATESAEVTGLLNNQQIQYKIDASGALLVEESAFHRARIALAGAGISDSRDIGFELMTQDQGFGTSQFMENARYLRSIEGELARTITSFRTVRGARVHLAVPRQSVFVRDRRPPSASVFLELSGGELSEAQVRAVTNLVANSVPELKPDRVSVVDQRGRLLSARSADPGIELAARQLKYQHEVEDRLRLRIESLLSRIVGPDRFRTELSVDMDFTQVEEAVESFDPTKAAVRSQRVLSEDGGNSSVVGGIPGALSNQTYEDQGGEEGEGAPELPAALSVAQSVGSSGSTGSTGKYEEVKNFELERQMVYRRGAQGQVTRLSVAVAIDDLVSTDPDTGETIREPWKEADLERLERLVREAVGISEARGDSISIENTPFAALNEAPLADELPIWQQPWVLSIARQAAGVAFVLLLVFGVLRPWFKSMSQVGGGPIAVAGGGSMEFEGDGGSSPASQAAGSNSPLGLPNMSGEGGSGEADVSLPGRNAGYEKQLDAIRSLVAEDPGRVAQVVKEWVSEE